MNKRRGSGSTSRAAAGSSTSRVHFRIRRERAQSEMLKRSSRFVLAAGVALALLAASASSANRDPKNMVLRLQDMPTGLAVTTSLYTSVAAAAKSGSVSVAQYKAWGYLTAYESDFEKKGSIGDMLTSASQITSSVTVYRTSAGAAKSLASSVATCNKAPFKELSVGATIGDKAHLCSATRKSGGVTVQIYAVLWRRGDLKAAVLTAGVVGGTSPTQAVKLAQVQDKRMR
jgi:hypothetical protein